MSAHTRSSRAERLVSAIVHRYESVPLDFVAALSFAFPAPKMDADVAVLGNDFRTTRPIHVDQTVAVVVAVDERRCIRAFHPRRASISRMLHHEVSSGNPPTCHILLAIYLLGRY